MTFRPELKEIIPNNENVCYVYYNKIVEPAKTATCDPVLTDLYREEATLQTKFIVYINTSPAREIQGSYNFNDSPWIKHIQSIILLPLLLHCTLYMHAEVFSILCVCTRPCTFPHALFPQLLHYCTHLQLQTSNVPKMVNQLISMSTH